MLSLDVAQRPTQYGLLFRHYALLMKSTKPEFPDGVYHALALGHLVACESSQVDRDCQRPGVANVYVLTEACA